MTAVDVLDPAGKKQGTVDLDEATFGIEPNVPVLNQVVTAEKQAQANLIRRREETAATRSLLNTAKLMEDNPTLLRLKELEALEKLVEKVGRIDLHTGGAGGFDALLQKLYSLRGDAEPKAV